MTKIAYVNGPLYMTCIQYVVVQSFLGLNFLKTSVIFISVCLVFIIII